MQLKAGVIGQPIAHSKSPALHRAAYRLLGVDIDYQRIEVAPENLAEFVARVRSDGDWAGVSVTMPHKAAMLRLVDENDVEAVRTGALNTVVVDRADARLRGRNTDIVGIVKALGHSGMDTVEGAVLLGGGGTARAALAALELMGCQTVVCYLRDPAKGASLVEFAGSLGLDLGILPFSEAAGLDAELLISTLPPGAADRFADRVCSVPRTPGKLVLDVAYQPWPSRLGQAWTESGGVAVSGLEMLLYQAVEQVAAFSGINLAGRHDVINVMCDSIGLPER